MYAERLQMQQNEKNPTLLVISFRLAGRFHGQVNHYYF